MVTTFYTYTKNTRSYYSIHMPISPYTQTQTEKFTLSIRWNYILSWTELHTYVAQSKIIFCLSSTNTSE
jgi:hypothetical protein